MMGVKVSSNSAVCIKHNVHRRGVSPYVKSRDYIHMHKDSFSLSLTAHFHHQAKEHVKVKHKHDTTARRDHRPLRIYPNRVKSLQIRLYY